MLETSLISSWMILLICIISTATFIKLLNKKTLSKEHAKAIFKIYLFFIVCLFILYYLQNRFNPAILITTLSILFSINTILILKKSELYKTKYVAYLTLIVIFSVGLGYISYTAHFERQHDSRSFYNYSGGGHFGYIGYIFFNNHLPTGSPKDFWCFYNPPLFYIISAISLKIQTLMNIELDQCFENLQFLSLLYTTIFNIYVYRILKELNVKKALIPLLLFVGLSPAMIIMSGSLNNDILSIALSTMSIYYTIKWYNSDSFKDLLKIALTISFAIMTKISSALIAVAIAFVFLVKVLNNKQDIKKYIKYFSIFALISLPIGLWFPIKNLVLYNIPITYVQSVDLDNDSNISNHSTFERFFKISDNQLKNINIDMSKENAEYNLYTTTLKSFIIDEHIDYSENNILRIAIPLIYWLSICISILFLINLIYLIANYKTLDNKWFLFFIGLFILEILSYIKFCFDFPFTFTMNFRYIVPTLICSSALTGISCEKNKKLFYLNTTLLSIFALLSILIFTNL